MTDRSYNAQMLVEVSLNGMVASANVFLRPVCFVNAIGKVYGRVV